MAQRFKHRKNGFSLVEVLLAIGIFSIGTVFVIQALSFASRTTGICQDTTLATFMAEDALQDIEFKERAGILEGEGEQASDQKGTFAIRSTREKETEKLYRWDLEITWQRPNRKDSLKLATFLRTSP